MQHSSVYTVNYMQDRLDITVMRAFANKANSLKRYGELVMQLDRPQEQVQKLNSIKGLEYIGDTASRVASKNIIDFHFEADVLTSMDPEQIERYLSDVENCFSFSSVEGLGNEGPLWVDTLHHVCMFSVIARMLHHLILSGRIGHIVLLHRGDREEPRLDVIKIFIANTYGVVLDFVRLSDNWLRQISDVITNQTVILSMCDVPYEQNGTVIDDVKARKFRNVQFYVDNANSVLVECVSGSAALARRFKAHHVVMDYPTNHEAQIKPYDPNIIAKCPLDSWVFWPCLEGRKREVI